MYCDVYEYVSKNVLAYVEGFLSSSETIFLMKNNPLWNL